MKKIICAIVALAMLLSAAALAEGATYKVGICKYVDHASLDQIVENIENRLDEIGQEQGVTFVIDYQSGNADNSVIQQIISNFIADGVDLMIGVATPVAMQMQTATEDNQIPVVFAAVSDPEGVELVESMDAPGANITGTSDFLNTNAVMDLILAANPDAKTIGLLYDVGQDSATTPIADAKAYLDEKGVAYKDYPGTNNSEVIMAAQAAAADQVDAVFTPTDNTIMAA